MICVARPGRAVPLHASPRLKTWVLADGIAVVASDAPVPTVFLRRFGVRSRRLV